MFNFALFELISLIAFDVYAFQTDCAGPVERIG
jgi:hypothetical protein